MPISGCPLNRRLAFFSDVILNVTIMEESLPSTLVPLNQNSIATGDLALSASPRQTLPKSRPKYLRPILPVNRPGLPLRLPTPARPVRQLSRLGLQPLPPRPCL